MRSDDHGDPVTAVAISPDGRLGATGSRSGEVRFWDPPGGRLHASVGGFGDEPVAGAVLAGTSLITTGGGAARWTLRGDGLEGRRISHEPGSRSPVLGHGGRSVMVVQDGDLRWWSLDGSQHGRFQRFGRLDALALSGTGLIITGGDDGEVGAWRMPPLDRWSDPEQVWTFREREPSGQRLMRCCDRGRLVVSPRHGRVAVLDAETGAPVASFVPDGRPTAIAAHPDAPLVVLGDRDGSLTWWDACTGHRLGRVARAHTGRIRALALAPRTDLVLSASEDGTAALWRLHGRGPVARFAPAPRYRPAVPYGHEDPWALTAATGTPDGRHWLIGGAGGQVHLLEGALVPLRTGSSSGPTEALDAETLIDDVRGHRSDARAAARAARVLGTPGGVEGLVDRSLRTRAVDALSELVVVAEERHIRETAAIALAEVERDTATMRLSQMFNRHGPEGGGRLLAHFTGETAPTTEALIASLPALGNFLSRLTTAALAERGAAVVPALHDALRAFPFPAQDDTGHWFRDESTKYDLMSALAWVGPAAAPVTPTLLDVLEDEEIYRDTRHQAKLTLRAIGLPETADVIAAEIRRRAEADPGDEDAWDYTILLDVLAGMPAEALAAAPEVGPALTAIRREHGDQAGDQGEDGEARAFPPYEVRLAELVSDSLASRHVDPIR
ncbi:hypothetical protein [Actinomadura xylanilytica]|uniref:hypothetical protein n=1 Tax=Actinomadura xylanilytica TaxID=887459 RepID=UPI00255B3C36|nr:hypothetical protein [Actinomadura xylanilytica]MDL4772635.1 hypothetical protein [Actinomadura xylanilytica]